MSKRGYTICPRVIDHGLPCPHCGERLSEKVVTELNEYYTWTRTPGVPNDRADALVYACALSGYEGIGEEKRVKAAPPKRKISMVSV